MDYKEIKRLMDDMGDSKLNSLEIEFPEGIKIKMKKDLDEAKQIKPVIECIQERHEEPNLRKIEKEIKECKKEKKEGTYITSPMVGTFYSKASPTAEAFVKVGDKVKKGDTLCIIEAMKLMNEIEADKEGEIAEILVKDEEMVDFGKKLFRMI